MSDHQTPEPPTPAPFEDKPIGDDEGGRLCRFEIGYFAFQPFCREFGMLDRHHAAEAATFMFVW